MSVEWNGVMLSMWSSSKTYILHYYWSGNNCDVVRLVGEIGFVGAQQWDMLIWQLKVYKVGIDRVLIVAVRCDGVKQLSLANIMSFLI